MKKNFLKTLPVQVNAAMLFIALTGTSFAVEPPALISDRASVDNNDEVLLNQSNQGVWSNGKITVGDTGPGTVRVADGVNLSVSSIVLGTNTGSDGRLLFEGAGSYLSTNSVLRVGHRGSGVINVTSGSQINVTGNGLSLGYVGTSSHGEIYIDGSGSEIRVGSSSVIGSQGSGKLVITNGGRFIDSSNGNFDIGYEATGRGEVIVDGAGSTLSGANIIWIGGVPNQGNAYLSNATGTLTIRNGGRVATSVAVVAGSANGGTGTIIIGAAEGQSPVAAGSLDTPTVIISYANGSTGNLILNHTSTDFELGALIKGTGSVKQLGANSVSTLSSSGNIYSGDTQVMAGTLRAGAAGAFSPNSAFTVQSGAALNLNGYDQTVKSLENAGVINFGRASATPGTTLTVNGNYTGGGVMAMNVALGDDTSVSDKLVVLGDTSGNTHVNITNIGGTGAATADGIQIVQVGGQSNGTFALQGRVVAGAYDYNLYQGKSSDPTDGNWYLRSVGSAIQPANPLNPVNPVNPQPLSSVSGIRPEAGAYLGNQTSAVNMFMHTLHDRLGELQFTESNKTDSVAPAVWLRITSGKTDSQAVNSQLDLSTDTTMVQIGAELAKWSTANSRFHFGVMAGYGHSKTDATNPHAYSSLARNATGKVDGYSVGMYATWYGDTSQVSGPYVDTWLQYAWFDNEVKGSGLPKESYDSSAWLASVEAGYAFLLSDNGQRQWLIEPQAQMIYNSYDADDVYEKTGSTLVHNTAADGLTTRLGIRVYTHQSTSGYFQPFVEANWWHGDADNSLKLNQTMVNHNLPEDRYEVKAGLQARLTKNLHGWASIGWQTGNNDYQSVEGKAGVKYVW